MQRTRNGRVWLRRDADRSLVDPNRTLGCRACAGMKGLAAANGGLNFGGQLGRDTGLDADPALLVLDALQRTARADLLDQRARVVGQRRSDRLPARGRGFREPGAERVEALTSERRDEYRGREFGTQRFAEGFPLLTVEPIRLVHHEQPRAVLEMERAERLVDDTDVLVEIRMGHVGD